MGLSNGCKSQDLTVSDLLFLECYLFVANHDIMKLSEFKCINESVCDYTICEGKH